MEIRIGKTARTCGACGQPFAHEARVYSLVRVGDVALVREDYCAECWNADRAVGSFSHWSIAFQDPKVLEQKPPKVFSPMRQAFYEAVETQDRAQLAQAYLAAQLLRRQKVFRLMKEFDEAEAGGRVAVFLDRIGDRLVEVRDPDLSFEELEVGRQALLQRLAELERTNSDSQELESVQRQEA